MTVKEEMTALFEVEEFELMMKIHQQTAGVQVRSGVWSQ